MAVAIKPDRDAFDLTSELEVLQLRLKELDRDQQAAFITLRDAMVQKVVADTRLRAIRAEIDVAKARSMSLMSILRAIPK